MPYTCLGIYKYFPCNSLLQPEGLRLRAIGRIRSLTKLNGVTVSENEATAALRMAAGSRISQVIVEYASLVSVLLYKYVCIWYRNHWKSDNGTVAESMEIAADNYFWKTVTGVDIGHVVLEGMTYLTLSAPSQYMCYNIFFRSHYLPIHAQIQLVQGHWVCNHMLSS